MCAIVEQKVTVTGVWSAVGVTVALGTQSCVPLYLRCVQWLYGVVPQVFFVVVLVVPSLSLSCIAP
jgi:hypothetical protein